MFGLVKNYYTIILNPYNKLFLAFTVGKKCVKLTYNWSFTARPSCCYQSFIHYGTDFDNGVYTVAVQCVYIRTCVSVTILLRCLAYRGLQKVGPLMHKFFSHYNKVLKSFQQKPIIIIVSILLTLIQPQPHHRRKLLLLSIIYTVVKQVYDYKSNNNNVTHKTIQISYIQYKQQCVCGRELLLILNCNKTTQQLLFLFWYT